MSSTGSSHTLAVERPAQRVDMLSRLHANIQDVFNEHGVQIMSPHYMTGPQPSRRSCPRRTGTRRPRSCRRAELSRRDEAVAPRPSREELP